MGFTDSAEVRKYIGGIFETAFQDPEIGPKLKDTGLVVAFDFTDPAAVVVIDMVNQSVRDGHEGGAPAMATMAMTAETGNAYWQGKVNLPLAMAKKKIRVEGNVDRARYDLGSLRAVLCGSAPAPVWLWQRMQREWGVDEIVTGYGMTECGGAMTLTLPEDPLERTSDTVGRPKLAGAAGVDDTDALVVYRAVDPETGQDVGVGADGVLVSRGPTAMLGYWTRPEETAEAMRDGWLHSGDIGRVGADGYLQVTGRSKELYKSGGELVMPKEIEDLLAGFDDVSQAFAVGLDDERWGQIGCVVVVPAPGAALTERVILDRCRAHLAKFKVPKKVVFREAGTLPTTSTGKVQKVRLAEELQRALSGSDVRV